MIDSTLEYLYQLHNRGIKLGLDNIKKILKECDNPQFKFRSIHLAGTNGKGSTASIASKILQISGYKVGLYTSPHLINFNERIRIDGKPISNNEIIDFTKTHKNFFEKHSITFFEATTAMAFDYFKKNNVDIAIVETGLGGRLDPANYFDADISVITKIALDHENILGKGVENIGREKAGIFRTNQTVIFGEGFIPNSVLKIVEKLNVDLHKVDDTNIESAYFHKNSLGISKKIFELQFPEIDAKSELDKIDEFEFLGRNHLVLENLLLDVSHNSDSIENLKNFINKHYSAFKLNAIFTCNKDKQLPNILKPILNIIDDWYLPELNHPQIMKNIEIENYLVRKGKKVFCGYDISEINDIVNKTNKNTLFVAFGSFKLVGKFYEILNIKIENTK